MKSFEDFLAFSMLTFEQLSWLKMMWLTVGLLMLMGVLYGGANVDVCYYWGLLALPVPVWASIRCSQKRMNQKKLATLHACWGRVTDRKRDFTDIASLSAYEVDQAGDSRIDDQTWSDLHMDDVYTRMDTTLTSPGQSVLYRMLRTPLHSEDTLRQRDQVIQLFQVNQIVREGIQMDLLRLGKERTAGIAALVWGPVPAVTRLRHVCTSLAFIALLVPALGYCLSSLGPIVVLMLLTYLINALVTHALRRHYLFYLSSIRYMGSMIRVARSLAELNAPGLEPYSQSLKTAAMACESIAQKTFLLRPEDALSSDLGTFVYGHLNIYFLREVRIYFAVVDRLRTCQRELQTVYTLLGELDALVSVASFRQYWGDYLTEPVFTEQEVFLEVRDLIHPLIPDPVPNSVTVTGQGVTVTGSNMAGKTTFLRTLGVNAILAQTVYMVLASYYRTRFFRIVSSLSEHDDLLAEKSYYLVEAENLLRMIKAAEQGPLTLCLIDEPLAGTNSRERIVASQGILNYLIKHHALVVTTTHDLNLAHALEPDYASIHFTDDVGPQGLRFDYILRLGIATTTNAITLLDYLDYPAEIVLQAKQQLDNPKA
jgi:hypothetical protein